MIPHILQCKTQHEFESWFSSSNEYEKLKKKNLLECLFCESNQIEKSIMAPRISNSLNSSNNDNNFPSDKDFARIKKDLLKIQKFVEKNFHFVGDNFAKEVKEIYYNKQKNINIYGTTTIEEREELAEEGIELATIPWIKKEN